MEIVLPYDFTEGTPAVGEEVMANLEAITAVVNGNLGSDNFGSAGGPVPVGAILDYGGSAAPSGFLLCDGSVVSRTDYAALFAVLSTEFNIGGEAGSAFRLPDFRGRVAVGPDGSAGRLNALDTVGDVGGEQSHQLLSTESGMPAHNPAIADGTHFHGVQRTGNQLYATLVAAGSDAFGMLESSAGLGSIDTGASATGITSSVAAQNAASVHNNMQPYQVSGGKIIKT